MAGKIDRTIEPEIGEDSAVKETSSGVRIRKKAKKKAVEKKLKPSTQQTEPHEKVVKEKLENLNSVVSSAEVTDEGLPRSEKIIEDFVPKISSWSQTLAEGMPRLEANTQSLLTRENSLIAALDDFSVQRNIQKKFSIVIVGAAATSIVVSLIFFLITSLSFSSKNEEFGNLSLALGKRIVELNSGLTSFNEARSQLVSMQVGLENLAADIERLGIDVDESKVSYLSTEQEIQGQLLNYSQELSAEVAAQTANVRENLVRLDGQFSNFNSRMLDFEEALGRSESTVRAIGDDASSLLEIKEVIDALLTLEREKYYDAITGTDSSSSVSELRVSPRGGSNDLFNQRGINLDLP
ncbi:hypothetical protein N9D99_00735 [Gammaproteobacteria bacterium]|nr:hypothetical protein [Gammaproteobacteria bacterium]